MKRAICLPYCEDQNAPSQPLRKIIALSDNKKKRDAMLKSLFIEHVCNDFDDDEITVRKGSRDDFGDIVVAGPYGTYMFVTYVK